MRTAERVVELPREFAGVDAWELLPDLAPFAGRRVRIIIEDLASQRAGACICGPGGYCDPECLACQPRFSCLGGQ